MRAMRMSPTELKKFTEKLIAQQKQIQDNLVELSIYSNGSFTFNDLLQLPAGMITTIEKIVVKKLKQDRGIKEQAML